MRALAILPLFALAACATTQAGDEPIEVAPQGECDAAPVQSFVGQRTSVELAARIRAESRAEAFRWIPPRSAVTQDYRPDRVNVVYDDEYVIERIYCG